MTTVWPWVYPYEDDGDRLGSVVRRPVVSVTVVGADTATPARALVDSGCEHVLVGPWVARAALLDRTPVVRELDLGIGGSTQRIQFVSAALRLHPPGGDDVEYVEWEAEVGVMRQWRPGFPVLLGQVGFFSHFTVTMSRMAEQLAVEPVTTFDERFGVPLAP